MGECTTNNNHGEMTAVIMAQEALPPQMRALLTTDSAVSRSVWHKLRTTQRATTAKAAQSVRSEIKTAAGTSKALYMRMSGLIQRIEERKPEAATETSAWQRLMGHRAKWQDKPDMEDGAIDECEGHRPVDKVRSHNKRRTWKEPKSHNHHAS
jgi:hypothetical protein